MIDLLVSSIIFGTQINWWLCLCLEPCQLMPGFQRIIYCLWVEPANLLYDGPRENIVECKVAHREEHLQDLRDPEQPDPGRHLFNIFLQRILYLNKLRLVEISPLLNQVNEIRDDKAAFMQTKCHSTEVALNYVLQGHLIFLVVEDSLV